MSEKKKKSLVIAGLTAAGLLAVGGAATITTLHSGSSETEKDPKDQLKDDLTNVKNDIDDLINSLDSEDNKEEIKILENLKDKIDQALQDPNITEGDLNSLKDEANQTLQDLINKKKEFDKNLLGKYDETKNVLDEYKNSLGDDPKYDSLKEKLDKLNEKLENSKNKHSESELLSKEQIQEIKKELEDTLKELEKIKFDKSLIDLEEAKKAKDEFLASFGNPVKPEYEELLNKYEDKWDEIDKNIESLPSRDEATLEDIKKVENIIDDIYKNVALETLEKTNIDLNKKLNNLIDNNTIEPLDEVLKQAWDKLYEDAKNESSFNNPESQNTQKIEEATKNYIDKSNQMIDDLTNLKDSEDLEKYKVIQELKNLINTSKDYSKNELSDWDYHEIKDQLNKVINQAEIVAGTDKDSLTIEQIKGEIQSLQEALDKAKADKEKMDAIKIDQAKDEIDNLIKDVNDFINSNLNTKGEEEIKNKLEEAIKNNTPNDSDDLNSLKDKLDELNKSFNDAKNQEKEREQLVKDLEQELDKAQEFVDNNFDENKYQDIKNELQDLINKTKDSIDDFSNQELKDKRKEIINAVEKAKNDKLIAETLDELDQKINQATNLIGQNKNNDKGEKEILDKLISARDEALNKYNELKSAQDISQAEKAKQECEKLSEAINTFENEKSQRDQFKKQLTDLINTAENFVNNDLREEIYNDIKNTLNEAIKNAADVSVNGNKSKIEQAINDLNEVLADAYSNKIKVDQEIQSKNQAKNELENLVADIEKWQKDNLKDSNNLLIKNGYSDIDSETTGLISKGKEDLSNPNSTSQTLKESYSELNTKFQEVQNKLNDHKTAFSNLQTKLEELNDLITKELNDPLYKDIKDKYQAKLDSYNGEKDNKNLEQIKQTIIDVINDIENLKEEKASRDLAKNNLEKAVNDANEFIATIDKTNPLNSDFVSHLEELITKANEAISKATSDQELDSLREQINSELTKLKTNKYIVDSLINLENKIKEIQQVIDENQSADAGLKSVIDELKTAKENAVTNLNGWKENIDSTTQIQVNTEINKLNNALNKFNSDKAAREEAKVELQNKINEANTLLETLTKPEYTEIKNSLNESITTSKDVLTSGNKGVLDNALAELEKKIQETILAKNNIDQNATDKQAAIDEITKTIQKMNDWKANKLDKPGASDILSQFNTAQSVANQIKDDTNSTLDQLKQANRDLNTKFNEIISSEKEYSTNYQKVSDKITELQNYINNNLSENIYSDLKTKYDTIVTNATTSLDSKKTSELKTLFDDLNKALSDAKSDKTSRDSARSELQKSIDSANNVTKDLTSNVVNNKLVEKLNELKNKAQTQLSSSTTDEELKATAKEINDEIVKVVQNLKVANELNRLTDKLDKVKTILDENKNSDPGLNSVVSALQSQYDASKAKFDNWLNNIDSNIVSDVAVEENILDNALNKFDSNKSARENSKTQLSNLINKVKEYKDNTLSTNPEYSELATKAEELISKYTPYLQSQTKEELDQSVSELNGEFTKLQNQKIMIDQQNQNEEQTREQIELLTREIKQWQSTNLKNGANGELKKQGYQDINNALETALTAAQSAKNDQSLDLKKLQDEYLKLNLAFNDAKNSLISHQNAYQLHESATAELKKYIDNEAIGNELKTKYQTIVDEYTNSKDSKNETKLKEDTIKLNQALEQLRNEKRERDSAINDLKNKISEVKSYVYSLPSNELSAVISSSLNSLITESVGVQNSEGSKQDFEKQTKKLDDALAEAKNKKDALDSLISLSNKIKEAENTLAKPEYSSVSSAISGKLQEAIQTAKEFIEQTKNNLSSSLIPNIQQKTTELNEKINQFIADVKEFNVAKEALEKVASGAQNYINVELVDPTYSDIKNDLQAVINKKTDTIANGDTQALKELTAEISDKLAEAKVNKVKRDQENAEKKAIKDQILKLMSEMLGWSTKNIKNSGANDIKQYVTQVTGKARKVKDNPDSTLENLKEALQTLNDNFTTAKNRFESYSNSLSGLETKISELQNYINVDLKDAIYSDIKTKYQVVVDKYNGEKTKLNDQALNNAISEITSEIERAKVEKVERDNAKNALTTKIQEVNQFVNSLDSSVVYNQLKNELNTAVNQANVLLTKSTDNPTLNAKTTELDNLLARAKTNKPKYDSLANLEKQLAVADKLLKDNANADSGLSSVISALQSAKDAAKVKYNSWVTNPISSDSITVEQTTNALIGAIEQFKADKAARDASKTLLSDNIAKGNFVADTTLNKDQYLELKNELATFLKDQEQYLTTANKDELDRKTEEVKAKIKDILARKEAIDQAVRERQEESSKLNTLIENVKNWQNSNLRDSTNNTVLWRQGLSEIDNNLSQYIKVAEFAASKNNYTAETLRKTQTSLENALKTAQTKFASYNSAYTDLENKIRELNNYINSDLTNNASYTDIKNKYQTILDESNKNKDALTESQLIEESAKLVSALQNAKADKENRDKELSKAKLQELINTATEYSNNTTDGVGASQYSTVKAALVQTIDKAKLNIDSQTKVQLDSRYTELESALNKAKKDKITKALEIHSAAISESETWISSNLDTNKPAESGNGNSLKSDFEAAISGYRNVSSNNANDIYSKAQSIKEELDKLKVNKATRDAAVVTLNEQLTKAKDLLILIPEGNQFNTLKTKLENEISRVEANTNSWNTQELIEAKKSLETVFNESVEGFRNNLRTLNSHASRLLEESKDLSASLNPTYTNLQTKVNESTLKINVIDYKQIAQYYTETKTLYDALIPKYNSLLSNSQQLNQLLKELEAEIERMKAVPNGNVIYKYWIAEATDRLETRKNYNSEAEVKNNITYLTGYIPALKNKSAGIDQAYAKYLPAKQKSDAFRNALNGYSQLQAKYDEAVTNPAKVFEDAFMAEGKERNQLDKATTALSAAEKTFKNIIEPISTQIQGKINGDWQQTLAKIIEFSKVTTSPRTSDRGITLDATAIAQRDALVKEYNTLNPQNLLNNLTNRIAKDNKPSYQEYVDLLNKINTYYSEFNAKIEKIYADNWNRNGAKHTFTLTKKELDEKIKNNIYLNSSSGLIDKQAIELKKTITYTYTGNDKTILTNYANEMQKIIELYKLNTSEMNKRKVDLDASSQSYRDSEWYKNKAIEWVEKYRNWNDNYFGISQTYPKYLEATRNFATGGMTKAQNFITNLFNKRNSNEYGFVESFMLNEMLKSIKTFLENWDSFGSTTYKQPQKLHSSEYQILRRYIFTYYRISPSNPNDSVINIWTNDAMTRYGITKEKFNYDTESVESVSNYNTTHGILNFSRRDWWGGIKWNVERERMHNINRIFNTDGMFDIFSKAWSDIEYLWYIYSDRLTKYQNNEISDIEFVNFKNDYYNLFEKIYKNNYTTINDPISGRVNNLSITYSMMHPTNLGLIYDFIKKH